MSYVFKKTEEQLWTVGHYTPDGTWQPDSDHGSEAEAAARTHWLNGGDPTTIQQLQAKEREAFGIVESKLRKLAVTEIMLVDEGKGAKGRFVNIGSRYGAPADHGDPPNLYEAMLAVAKRAKNRRRP